MKKYVADNLMFLRDYYPDIYQLIRNQDYDRSRVQVIESQNHQVNLLVTLPDQREVALYSRYDPQAEAERWLKSIESQYAKVQNILFCGLGLGYHLKVFMERFPDKKIFLYEPDLDIFMAAVERVNLIPLLKSKQLALFGVGTGEAFQRYIVSNLFDSLIANCDLLVVPSYRKVHANTIDELMNVIKSVSRGYRSNLNTMYRFQDSWAENIILNLRKVLESHSFRSLKGIGNGVPAIIVGSGPSLAMESEWLKRLKNHAIIIAAGSSVQGLVHHGIEPDLIVSMDPSEVNAKVFEGLNIHHIPFLFIPTIKHTILDADWNLLLHAYFNNDAISRYYMELDEGDPVFNTTSTVTGTAIQAALYMQCTQIFFIGQDFSFPNDQHYATGVQHISENDLKNTVQRADVMIENVSGGKNRTSQAMLVLKESIEALIEIYPHAEFYNASRIGAVIRHTKVKTLEELYSECQQTIDPQGFTQQINQYLETYPSSKISRVMGRLDNSKKAIESLSKYVDDLKTLVEESTRYQNHPRRIQKWFEKFNKTWNNMDKHEYFKSIYRFLLYAEYDFVRRNWTHIAAETDQKEQMRKLVNCILPIIAGFHKVTPVLKESIEEVIDRLQLSGSRAASGREGSPACS